MASVLQNFELKDLKLKNQRNMAVDQTNPGSRHVGARIVSSRVPARAVSAVGALGLLLALSGCSALQAVWGEDTPSSTENSSSIQPASAKASANGPSAEKLYAEGQKLLSQKEYKKAAKQFEEVERQHPYSPWARRGILMTAFAHYERNQYDNTILAARRFITLYPGHKDAPYAYYLIGLSYYEQIIDVGRDQRITQQALDSLTEVERRFPDSQYAADAKRKSILARDHLAGKEMKVGRYYLKKHAYVAAINRFRKVVTDYQTTSHTPEALMRLSEAYMALGVKGEAQTAAAVLGHNFPDTQWYQDSYTLLKTDGLEPRENKESWISLAWKSITPF